MESKNEKFIRLAEARVNSVIQKIQLIGNLSNRRNYDYSEKEVNELFKAIELELQRAKKLFEVEVSKENSKFRFSKKGE
ncbi:hypothetical protein O3793_05470 [Granulicatella sp. 20925_1_28]|jgi:hypothetical protein|uniref:hypothetical protein n=1 Tax=Granulicatella sp. 20925_1_28 TaxID=3003686 RepID=UPI00352D66B3